MKVKNEKKVISVISAISPQKALARVGKRAKHIKEPKKSIKKELKAQARKRKKKGKERYIEKIYSKEKKY